ncbi:MAG: XRE family transcriptional regulator [Pseudomonadota bacterium]|nr:XRE family transcriptional regulator [Pseudomonadota bacterium]
MTETFNRDMLQLARAARGLTQGGLAARAGVTQALISKLENGLTLDPTGETVGEIARALNFPVRFFYAPERPHGLPPFHYRRRASLGARALAKIEADINIRRMHLARLLRSYEVEAHREFPIIDLERHQWSPRDAAQHIRGYWSIPRGPINNLTQIVENVGAIIVQIDFGTPKLDALSFRLPGMPPLIFMNSTVPGDRYRFTLAHELAHLILHHHPETDEEMESQADEFAAELLMPAREIKPYLVSPSLGKLARVKPYWKVSIKALIVQAHRLKTITPSQYTGLNVNYSKAGYARFGEPFPIAIERPSRLSDAVQHHLRRLGYSIGEIADLLMIHPEEFQELYTEQPRLRLVK